MLQDEVLRLIEYSERVQGWTSKAGHQECERIEEELKKRCSDYMRPRGYRTLVEQYGKIARENKSEAICEYGSDIIIRTMNESEFTVQSLKIAIDYLFEEGSEGSLKPFNEFCLQFVALQAKKLQAKDSFTLSYLFETLGHLELIIIRPILSKISCPYLYQLDSYVNKLATDLTSQTISLKTVEQLLAIHKNLPKQVYSILGTAIKDLSSKKFSDLDTQVKQFKDRLNDIKVFLDMAEKYHQELKIDQIHKFIESIQKVKNTIQLREVIKFEVFGKINGINFESLAQFAQLQNSQVFKNFLFLIAEKNLKFPENIDEEILILTKFDQEAEEKIFKRFREEVASKLFEESSLKEMQNSIIGAQWKKIKAEEVESEIKQIQNYILKSQNKKIAVSSSIVASLQLYCKFPELLKEIQMLLSLQFYTNIDPAHCQDEDLISLYNFSISFVSPDLQTVNFSTVLSKLAQLSALLQKISSKLINCPELIKYIGLFSFVMKQQGIEKDHQKSTEEKSNYAMIVKLKEFLINIKTTMIKDASYIAQLQQVAKGIQIKALQSTQNSQMLKDGLDMLPQMKRLNSKTYVFNFFDGKSSIEFFLDNRQRGRFKIVNDMAILEDEDVIQSINADQRISWLLKQSREIAKLLENMAVYTMRNKDFIEINESNLEQEFEKKKKSYSELFQDYERKYQNFVTKYYFMTYVPKNIAMTISKFIFEDKQDLLQQFLQEHYCIKGLIDPQNLSQVSQIRDKLKKFDKIQEIFELQQNKIYKLQKLGDLPFALKTSKVQFHFLDQNKDVYRILISLYTKAGYIPRHYELLQCTEYLSMHDIDTFLLRAFRHPLTSPIQRAFVIYQVEALDLQMQREMQQMISKYEEQFSNIAYCLYILTAIGHQNEEIEERSSKLETQPLDIKEMKAWKQKIDTKLIFSEESEGLGKSTMIKNQAKGLQLCRLLIDNQSTRLSIVTEIQDCLTEYQKIQAPGQLLTSQKKLGLHFDLIVTHLTKEIDSIFFEFLLFGQITHSKGKVMVIPSDTRCWIEVSSNITQEEISRSMLGLIEQENIGFSNMPKLDIKKLKNYKRALYYIDQIENKSNDLIYTLNGFTFQTEVIEKIMTTQKFQEILQTLFFNELQRTNFYVLKSFLQSFDQYLTHIQSQQQLNENEIEKNYDDSKSNINAREFLRDLIDYGSKHSLKLCSLELSGQSITGIFSQSRDFMLAYLQGSIIPSFQSKQSEIITRYFQPSKNPNPLYHFETKVGPIPNSGSLGNFPRLFAKYFSKKEPSETQKFTFLFHLHYIPIFLTISQFITSYNKSKAVSF